MRLIRPRFEVLYLTVEAKDHDIAEGLAYISTGGHEAEWKLIDHSPEDYHPYVELCLSENELSANEMTAEDAAEELSSTKIPEWDKYLIAHADTNSGEGTLCEQPWFWGVSELMKLDLCADWSIELQALAEEAEEDLSADGLGDDSDDDDDDASAATKEMLAKVLRKRRRPKPGGSKL